MISELMLFWVGGPPLRASRQSTHTCQHRWQLYRIDRTGLTRSRLAMGLTLGRTKLQIEIFHTHAEALAMIACDGAN